MICKGYQWGTGVVLTAFMRADGDWAPQGLRDIPVLR